MTTSTCGGSACIAGISRDCGHSVFRLEGGATRSQIKRDTNFATPGYSLSYHDTTARGKNKVFSVCGHLCGQSRFCAAFGNRGKSSKRRCCKALRRFTMPRPGYRHGTPKASALHLQSNPGFFSQRKHILNFLGQSAKEGVAADTADPSYFTGFPCKVKRILFCKSLFLQSPLQKQTRKCTLPGDNSTNNLPNRKPWHRKAQKPLHK